MAWLKGRPLGSDKISASDELIRDNWSAIETGDVPHDKVRFDEQGSNPSLVANQAFIFAKEDSDTNYTELFSLNSNGDVIQLTKAGNFGSGVAQIVSSSNSTATSTTTLLPVDNTVPQNTEGVELITQAITPISSTSTLIIDYYCSIISQSAAGTAVRFALFQDSTAAALHAAACSIGGTGRVDQMWLRHIMTSGTTSATTFKIRYGSDGSDTSYILQTASGQVFGGAEKQSLTITEIL